MSMSSTTAGFNIPSLFSVGGVFHRASSVLSRHLPLFIGVMAVAGLPSLLLNLALLGDENRPEALKLAGFAGILVLVLMTVSQTMIYHAAFQDMAGRPIRLGSSLGFALRRLLPVLGTAICMVLAIGVGFVLLIVPGFIFAVALCISVPVCVVEQVGPIHSLRRSMALTKGHRWKLVGIGLLVMVIGAVAGLLQFFCRLGLGMEAGAIAAFLIQSALSAFTSLIMVVIYHDLRTEKEGVDTHRMAAVFD